MELDRALLLGSFRDESDELLAELERLALALDAQPSNRALVEEMFRCAHTLKGSASCVGFDRVTAVAHELEKEMFEAVTSNRRSAGRWLSGMALEALDLLRLGCQAADEERDAPIAGAAELVARIVAWLSSDERSGEAVAWNDEVSPRDGRALRSLRVDVDKLDRLLNLAGEVAVAQGRLGALVDPGSEAHSAVAAFQGLFRHFKRA